MDYSKPTLLVISGPNGAGKSTNIQSMLPPELSYIQSYNRDLMAKHFEDELEQQAPGLQTNAGNAVLLMEKHLLSTMDNAIEARDHFVLETPLSAARFWLYIDHFQDAGYQVQLLYLCLDSVIDCKNRVSQRIQEGGLAVDSKTVEEIYEKNLKYINEYVTTFTSISLFDGMTIPSMLVRQEDNKLLYADAAALKKRWVRDGLPVIAQKVTNHFNLKNITGKRPRTTKGRHL